MGVTVQRQPADKPGESIVSPMLTTEAAQLERGRYEINNEYHDRIVLDGTITNLDLYQPGEMIEVVNKGAVCNGLLTKCVGHISLSNQSANIRTQVTVETIK